MKRRSGWLSTKQTTIANEKNRHGNTGSSGPQLTLPGRSSEGGIITLGALLGMEKKYLMKTFCCLIILCGIYIAHPVIGQISGADSARNSLTNETNAMDAASAYAKNNAWAVQGVLWGDGVTNGENMSVTMLVRNNGKRDILVPPRFNALLCIADMSTAARGLMYTIHYDSSGSSQKEYVRLRKGEVQTYTYAISVECDMEGDADIKYIEISLFNNLSAADGNLLEASGVPYVQGIQYKFGPTRFMENVKAKRGK